MSSIAGGCWRFAGKILKVEWGETWQSSVFRINIMEFCKHFRLIDQKSIDKLSIFFIFCSVVGKVTQMGFSIMLITNVVGFCQNYWLIDQKPGVKSRLQFVGSDISQTKFPTPADLYFPPNGGKPFLRGQLVGGGQIFATSEGAVVAADFFGFRGAEFLGSVAKSRGQVFGLYFRVETNFSHILCPI